MSVEQALFRDVRDLLPGYSWPAVKKGGAAAILISEIFRPISGA